MNKDEFLKNMQDILETDEVLDYDTVLDNLEEWDSLSKLATVTFLDNIFGIKATFSDFENFKTIGDIATKVGL